MTLTVNDNTLALVMMAQHECLTEDSDQVRLRRLWAPVSVVLFFRPRLAQSSFSPPVIRIFACTGTWLPPETVISVN